MRKGLGLPRAGRVLQDQDCRCHRPGGFVFCAALDAAVRVYEIRMVEPRGSPAWRPPVSVSGGCEYVLEFTYCTAVDLPGPRVDKISGIV